MFSDKLTESLLQLCHTRKLSYETASELCDISSRYFGDVIRKKSLPTLEVFEKMCKAFDKTPNELLGYPAPAESPFRIPKAITKAYCFHLPEHLFISPVCPQCGHLIENEYQKHCCYCGQALSWDDFEHVQLIELT